MILAENDKDGTKLKREKCANNKFMQFYNRIFFFKFLKIPGRKKASIQNMT